MDFIFSANKEILCPLCENALKKKEWITAHPNISKENKFLSYRNNQKMSLSSPLSKGSVLLQISYFVYLDFIEISRQKQTLLLYQIKRKAFHVIFKILFNIKNWYFKKKSKEKKGLFLNDCDLVLQLAFKQKILHCFSFIFTCATKS